MQHDWIDDDEYPDEDDIEAFGYGSPPDDDPLTIGYIDDSHPHLWTTGRVVMLILGLMLIGALVLPLLASLLR